MRRFGVLLLIVAGACSFTAQLDPSSSGTPDAATADAPPTDSVAACSAPQLRGTSHARTGSADGVDVMTPPGTQANDVLLAIVLYRSDSDQTVGMISAPGGWTLVRRDSHGGDGTIGQSVYVRTAAADEPATHTFTTGNSKRFIAIIHAYTGVDTASPVAVDQGRANTASETVAVPAMSVAPCSRVVGAFGSRSLSTFTTAPGLTERVERTNDIDGDIAIETADGVLAGDIGTLAATASDSAVNIGQAIALAPAR